MLHNENPDLCWQHGCPEHEAPDWIKDLVNERNKFMAALSMCRRAAKDDLNLHDNRTMHRLGCDGSLELVVQYAEDALAVESWLLG